MYGLFKPYEKDIKNQPFLYVNIQSSRDYLWVCLSFSYLNPLEAVDPLDPPYMKCLGMNIWVFPNNRGTPKWMISLYNGKPY